MGQKLGYAFQCEEMLHFEHQEQKPENVHPGRTHITTSPKQPLGLQISEDLKWTTHITKRSIKDHKNCGSAAMFISVRFHSYM
jgi:hypothetical protein